MDTTVPRIEFDALSAELATALRPRVERLGYLGEFFKCAAHQPAALLAFMRLTDDLKEALPDALTEIVALTVAGAMDNRYERHQHERLSRRLGFSDEWIRAANRLEPDAAAALGDQERVAQRLALAVLRRQGHGVDAELAATVDVIGPAQAMAVLFLIGRYVTHSLIVNTLGLEPPVASIF